MRRSLWPRSGLAGAAARLAALLAGACGLILITTVPAGLLTHRSLDRAVSLGFYLVGAFIAVIGLAGGSRGPFRTVHDDQPAPRLSRRLRRATLEELNESMSLAAVAIVIGIALVVIGVAIDSRYALF